MNWLLIVVLGIIIINGLYGLNKGFIRTIFSFFSLLIAIGLTIWINPTVNSMMKENEKFYTAVTEKVEQMLPLETNKENVDNKDNIKNNDNIDNKKNKDNEKGNEDKFNKDKINRDKISKDKVKNNQIKKEKVNNEKVVKKSDIKDKDSKISDKEKQITYINELPLPKSLKDSLIKNTDDYIALGFKSFRSYISGYLAGIIINALAFIVTFIIINIILWTLFFTLNIISKLPVLHQINKLAGLGAGLLQGFVIVWIFFVILTVFGGTKLGQDALKLISEDQILSLIYNNNPILGFITNTTKLFF